MSSVKSYPAKTGPKGRLWEVLYRTPENRATRKRGFKTQREAESWRTSMESSKQTGTYISPSAGKVTVEMVGAQWRSARAHLKASTIANSATAWKRVMARWGSSEVGNVRTAHVRSWVATLVKDGVGVESIENAFSMLRQIMATAVEDRRVASNPCDGVKLPRRGHTHLMCLSHERVALLEKQVDKFAPGYGIVPQFLAYTGLRWNELAALKVQCFNRAARRFEVIEGVTEVAGELVWSTTKTHTRRTVPYPAFLEEQIGALCKGKGPGDLVFTSADGSVLRVSNFRTRVFGPALKACIEADPHFPKVTLRKLRNTAASLAIAEGATVKGVQAMLGHKSAAMTLDIYASLFPSDLDDVADRLNTAASPRTPGEDLRQLRGRVEGLVGQLEELCTAHEAAGVSVDGVDTDIALESLRRAVVALRPSPVAASVASSGAGQ